MQEDAPLIADFTGTTGPTVTVNDSLTITG